MNKKSQHEFRFTSHYGLQIACTRSKSRGPARGVVQFMNDPLCFPTLQRKSMESFWPLLYGWPTRMRFPKYGQVCQGISPAAKIESANNCKANYRQAGIRNSSHDFTKEGGRKCSMN
jgi:hypothetical protein